MKKKLLLSTLTLSILFSSTAFAKDISVTIDNKNVIFDQAPVVENGRTLVPMRGIFEAFDAQVEWDEETKTITATKGSTIIKMQLDSKKMSVNGIDKTLDVSPVIVGGRTLVPVRAISESLGVEIAWDNNTQTVLIGESAKSHISASTIDETDPLIKIANQYLSTYKMSNNCESSIAKIKSPKTVAELKENYNALPSYKPDTLKKDNCQMVGMDQVMTMLGKNLNKFMDSNNYKNNVIGCIKLDLFNSNSTLTFKRLLTKDKEVFSYVKSGQDFNYPIITIKHLGLDKEKDIGNVLGVVLKDNVVVGTMEYNTITKSDYAFDVTLFEEYKNSTFDTICVNIFSDNLISGDFDNDDRGKAKYIMAIVKLPNLKFEDKVLEH